MKDIIKGFAFFKQALKNSCTSSKEAAEGFRLFGEAIKNVQPTELEFPTHSARIWSEKTLDHAEDARFYSEYMQQPNIEVTNTYASGEAENIDPEEIRRAVARMTEREEERITDELLGTFDQTHNLPSRCPMCMRSTAWTFTSHDNMAKCGQCDWSYDVWGLANIEFEELRTQALELQTRQLEQRVQELEAQRDRSIVPSQVQAAPTSSPNMNMDIADEIRALTSHRDLTITQMRRLDELIGIVQNSPPPQLQSHPDEYMPDPQLRPLIGRGVSGNETLSGNEESLTFEGVSDESITREHIERAAEQFLTKEMYEGLGFGGDEKPKEKSIKPLNPPKRKLDI